MAQGPPTAEEQRARETPPTRSGQSGSEKRRERTSEMSGTSQENFTLPASVDTPSVMVLTMWKGPVRYPELISATLTRMIPGYTEPRLAISCRAD